MMALTSQIVTFIFELGTTCIVLPICGEGRLPPKCPLGPPEGKKGAPNCPKEA